MRKGFKSFGIILSIIILFSGCSSRVEVQENEKDIASIEESIEEETQNEDSKEEANEGEDIKSQEDTKTSGEDVKDKSSSSKTEEVKEAKSQVPQTSDLKDKEVPSPAKPQSNTIEVKPKEAPKVETPTVQQHKPEEKKQEEATPRGEFKDGTHTGSGSGHDGDIKVRVVVENGYIKSIDVLSHEDTKNIAENAFSSLRSSIINSQTADVNVVSGATYSSKGFIEGVKKALN